jgi:hypothetical protein
MASPEGLNSMELLRFLTIKTIKQKFTPIREQSTVGTPDAAFTTKRVSEPFTQQNPNQPLPTAGSEIFTVSGT